MVLGIRRTSQKIKKRSSENGWTVLEISLAVILTAILGLTFSTTVRKKRVAADLRECMARQWQWTNRLDQLETAFHQWEAQAWLCLKAGFSPAQAVEGGNVEFVELITARPTMETVRMSRFVSVPKEHFFTPGQRVLLCNPYEHSWSEIRRVYAGTGNTATLELREDDEASLGSYDAGSVIAAVQKVTLEKAPGDQPGTLTIFRREEDRRRRPFLRLLTMAELNVLPGNFGASSSFDWVLGYHDCSVERTFSVTPADREMDLGEWLLGEKQLFFKAWTDASRGGEDS